jgi:hypothetical protein
MNAIRVATETIQHHITDAISREIAAANERVAAAKLTDPVSAAA